MTYRKTLLPVTLGAAALAIGGALAGAQQQPAPQVENPAPAATGTMLGLTEIEALLQREGIRVQELEVRDRVIEAEGRDASNREVEVIVDRRSGEILSRRFDD